MDVLPCGHVARASRVRLCRHLLGPDGPPDDIEYVRVLTGRGIEYDLCCRTCDRAGTAPELLVVCEGCAFRAEEDETGMVGWRGRPEIRERPEGHRGEPARLRLPPALRRPLDWAALPGTDGAAYLFLTGRRDLVRFDALSGRFQRLATVSVPDDTVERPARRVEISLRLRPHLHVSRSGRYAAVVNDHGSRGAVVDLRTGRTTMTLDGGHYGTHIMPFALAFATHQGRDVMVHRTASNRLDVSDPATGDLLTARDATRQDDPEGRRGEHHLTYWHGALRISPDGRWIADNGRLGYPGVGTTVWDLRRWLEENPFESEDGPSRRSLCVRDYAWNRPVCWVSESLVAVFGIGSDDETLLDGVRVFDASTGTETLTFPGPSGDVLFADGRRLYSDGDEGLQIWDPSTGERTASVPGFHPRRHHPRAAELAAIQDGDLVRLPTAGRP
ncbi:WD40 repeat domain-containing protein [Actinomadura sp. SCN-SB]|uniref:WD40 repeat domain-containing protein n=1 Tax=Actinomadura sp. SCN-SB TaxID=3373092 RepID=UPI0037524A1A